MHVQSTSNGKKEVTGANVLVAIFGEKDSHAVYYLHQQGITRLDVVNFISHGITKTPQPKEAPGREEPAEAEADAQAPQQAGALDQYTANLNIQAKEGRIDPLIGREAEVERVIQVLCRRRKNNPLLVGEAGVGKTAIAEGLAWRITQKDVPDVLAEADFTGSTAHMIDWVKTRRPAKVVMVTECSMASNVAAEVPDVEFIKPCNLCPHMKMITLPNILHSLVYMTEEVLIDPAIAERARLPIERMINLNA
jgi:hypothetical protein